MVFHPIRSQLEQLSIGREDVFIQAKFTVKFTPFTESFYSNGHRQINMQCILLSVKSCDVVTLTQNMLKSCDCWVAEHGFVVKRTRRSLGQLFTNSPQCSRLLRYYLCTRWASAFCAYVIFWIWYISDEVFIMCHWHKNGRLMELFQIVTAQAHEGETKFRWRNDYF